MADLGDLFFNMGVFLAFTALVAAVCFWFVKQEDKKNQRGR